MWFGFLAIGEGILGHSQEVKEDFRTRSRCRIGRSRILTPVADGFIACMGVTTPWGAKGPRQLLTVWGGGGGGGCLACSALLAAERHEASPPQSVMLPHNLTRELELTGHNSVIEAVVPVHAPMATQYTNTAASGPHESRGT